MKRLGTALLVISALVPSAWSAWVNVTTNLAGHASACGNVYCLSAVPHQNKVIAGICGGQGLFASTDNGVSWQPMGASTSWVDPQDIVFDKDDPDIFWETGIHGGAAHKTTNGGTSFSLLGNGGNGDGIGVDMTDPLRKTIVIGGHEVTSISKSTDGGSTWTNISAGTSGATSFPVVFDAQTYIVAGNGGIFRTTDGGSAWTKVSSLTPSWAALVASDGTVYFAAGNSAILKGTAKGLTWTSLAKAGGGMGDYTPVEMPDNSIVAIGSSTLVQTSDGGATWKPIGGALPSSGGMLQGGLAYNEVASAFFMAYWDCSSTVPANAIWKQEFATGIAVKAKASTSRLHSGNVKMIRLLAARGASLSNSIGKTVEVFDLYGRQVRLADRVGNGIAVVRSNRDYN